MPAEVGTVVVTGGASGLGAAVAQCVRAAGGRPVVLDRRPAAGVEHVVVDLADTVAAERAVRGVVERHDGLDAVVACAGVDVPGRLDSVSREDWERVLAVNLLGMAAVVRAAVPALVASHGRVVTVASTLGLRGVSEATAYCASKFAVIGFTRALAAELDGSVGVTLLVPGGMATNFFADREPRFRPPPESVLCDPQAVADTVVYALSRPAGVEVRELVVCAPGESSWP